MHTDVDNISPCVFRRRRRRRKLYVKLKNQHMTEYSDILDLNRLRHNLKTSLKKRSIMCILT